MGEFTGVDRVNFRPFGLNALFSLRDVPIRHEFLLCVAHFWDPEVNVFCFGYEELCPTVKEFQALPLGAPSLEVYSRPHLPSECCDYLADCVELWAIPRVSCFFLTGTQRPSAHRMLSSHREPPQWNSSKALSRCSVYCPSDVLPPRALQATVRWVLRWPATVTSQMLEDKNMVPLVLAETLLGLDQICAEGVEGMLQFAGSPLLLQVIIFVYAPSFCHFSVP